MFFGRYDYTIDAKGRLNFPAKFRDAMGESFVVPDKQGRILLPAELRSYAGLEKDVTIIGNRNHAEIWATDVWNARRAAVSNEQRAARLRSLHI